MTTKAANKNFTLPPLGKKPVANINPPIQLAMAEYIVQVVSKPVPVSKKTYSEKLKDPRWQKCRLSVLNRDKFTCKICGDKETTLHVHHEKYERGKEPWEYPTTSLHTLCSDCHLMVEDDKRENGVAHIGVYKAYKFFTDSDMTLIIAYSNNIRIRSYGEDKELMSDVQIDGPHLPFIKKIISHAIKIDNLL